MEDIKKQFFSYYSSPYSLHNFETAWEEARIKVEEGMIAKGEALNYAFQCLTGDQP